MVTAGTYFKVALLANCGLFVPCSAAAVPRFDNFFLRTAGTAHTYIHNRQYIIDNIHFA